MLNVFKIKPFDYQAVYYSWPDAPVFTGRINKDMEVNVWLARMKEGCKKRKVPKGLWHKVAQHYLRGRAEARFEDLKKVMRNMYGGRYRWDWKKFEIAMTNMGWELNSKLTQAWNIGSVTSGVWWIIGQGTNAGKESEVADRPPTRQPFLLRPLRRDEGRSNGDTTRLSEEPSKVTANKDAPRSRGQTPIKGGLFHSIMQSGEPEIKTTHVPIWLLNVSHSLDVLVADYPRTMCALSAILVALGSVPSVPAVAAGGAGTFLTSDTAKTIGTVAIGVGNWFGGRSSGQQEARK